MTLIPETTEIEKTIRNQDLWKARFWQGFQSSIESSLSSGSAKVRIVFCEPIYFVLYPDIEICDEVGTSFVF
jgi:hypothetical protein